MILKILLEIYLNNRSHTLINQDKKKKNKKSQLKYGNSQFFSWNEIKIIIRKIVDDRNF